MGSRRWLLVVLLALALPIQACPEDGEPNRSGVPGTQAPPSGDAVQALRDEARLAALRGVAYLVRKRRQMPPEWSTSIFARLYRIAPTEGLAGSMRSMLDEALREPQGPIPPDLHSAELLDPKLLRGVLNELWRRRLMGLPWEAEGAALRSLLEEKEEDLWRAVALNHQFVFLHLLERIDIHTRRTQDDVARELRGIWFGGDQEALLLDVAFMYAITHVFYAGSGYFQSRMDPVRYPVEIDILKRALGRYVQDFPTNSNFVDISAEILASRRLLGLPDSEASLAMTRLLLERQKPNGSWLKPVGFQDYHATASAVHAFIQYPPEFRHLEPGDLAQPDAAHGQPAGLGGR